MKTPLLKKVKIGTLKVYRPEKIKDGYWSSKDLKTRKWINDEYSPRRVEWVDTGKTGLLYEFFVETDEDGNSSVVGLVELSDGQFDTFVPACIKLETPTAI